MQDFPTQTLLAIGVSLLAWPALWLNDHVNRGCGDGLCGSLSGLLILLGSVAATVVFVVRGARRQEPYPALRLAPLGLWLLLIVTLAI